MDVGKTNEAAALYSTTAFLCANLWFMVLGLFHFFYCEYRGNNSESIEITYQYFVNTLQFHLKVSLAVSYKGRCMTP